MFMMVYEAAIDTVFMCFLIDEDNNKGGKMLAHPELLKIIDESASSEEGKAEADFKKTQGQVPGATPATEMVAPIAPAAPASN